MSDNQFIRYLWKLLWKAWNTDELPSEDDVYSVKTELNKRGIRTQF